MTMGAWTINQLRAPTSSALTAREDKWAHPRLSDGRRKCAAHHFSSDVSYKEINDVISPMQKMQIIQGKSIHISYSNAYFPIFVQTS
jgi:hypothetical protein